MPVQHEPLKRPTFPAPDWRAEERERQQLEVKRRREERRLILEEELARIANDDDPPSPFPARKRKP